jgi:hypothetical protein
LQNVESQSADTAADHTTEVTNTATERELTISAPSDEITDYVTQNWSNVSDLELFRSGDSPFVANWHALSAETDEPIMCTALVPFDAYGNVDSSTEAALEPICRLQATYEGLSAAEEVILTYPDAEVLNARPLADKETNEFEFSFTYIDSFGDKKHCVALAIGNSATNAILVEIPVCS